MSDLNIEDISIMVTCPSCSRTYGVQIDRPHMRRNCRCGGGQLFINVEGYAGKKKANIRVHVHFTHNDGRITPVTPDSIEIN